VAVRPREGAAPQPHDVKPDARVGQAQHVALKGAALTRVRAGRQPRQVRRGRHRLHLVKVGAVAQDLPRGPASARRPPQPRPSGRIRGRTWRWVAVAQRWASSAVASARTQSSHACPACTLQHNALMRGRRSAAGRGRAVHVRARLLALVPQSFPGYGYQYRASGRPQRAWKWQVSMGARNGSASRNTRT